MALKRVLSIAPVAACMALLVACGGNGDGQQPVNDSLTPPPAKETEIIGVGGKFFSVPSPVQAALAIKQAGLKYQKELMAPLEKGDAMTARMAQATMLGAFGADMSYATVHKDGQRALATLQAIEKLGAKLELSNAFDKALVERFKANMSNEDSLLRFSGMAFRAADQYLKTNDAQDVSAWIIAGGWIEECTSPSPIPGRPRARGSSLGSASRKAPWMDCLRSLMASIRMGNRMRCCRA
ncbi:MAG: hypothetical protein IPJ85_03425 [Flavobacteriales bacterium]|nr:hypothetical protein [Flavobacteriales bacterium]